MDRTGKLSRRQREVAQLLAGGATNAGVAARLGISPRTVEVHRAAAMARLGAHNAVELGRLLLERGDELG